MLAEITNLNGVVIGAVMVLGAIAVPLVARWSWPAEPKWLRELERKDQERNEARRVLREEATR